MNTSPIQTITTQITLMGVAFEVEVDYQIVQPQDLFGHGQEVKIRDARLLGYYEGINSRAALNGDYAYLNVKCDLKHLTLEEQYTLEEACLDDAGKVKEEAIEEVAE